MAPAEAAHGLAIDEVCQVDSANSLTDSKLQLAGHQYVCQRRALALKQIGGQAAKGKKRGPETFLKKDGNCTTMYKQT